MNSNPILASAAGAAPAGLAIATFSLFGIQIEVLDFISILGGVTMSISTRIYVNIKSKSPISWRENLLLGTITTVLSIGVISEYNLAFLWSAAASIGIAAAGETIIATLGQGASDVLKSWVAKFSAKPAPALPGDTTTSQDSTQKETP